MQLVAKFKKILYMGFIATLNFFLNFKYCIVFGSGRRCFDQDGIYSDLFIPLFYTILHTFFI